MHLRLEQKCSSLIDPSAICGDGTSGLMDWRACVKFKSLSLFLVNEASQASPVIRLG